MKRIAPVFILSAAFLLQPICSGIGGPGTARADSQNVNFDGNSTKDITIPKGKADIFPECYGLSQTEYEQQTKSSFEFSCSSPVSNVTCAPNTGQNKTHCICHNPNNKSHTVKVHMLDNCSEP
ncbi:hypothetical protein [Ruegeria atlantica]|uniref:hypothetical protein n=1 Tax=Ruegeria atlantica TaxID=81569 RepID=UPI00147D1DB8|nr:hypothetical protein [Ruegeria atlantica]